jgi:hypothetical protein
LSQPISWKRVFIEGVVIVGSILLAFGIQAWWDGLQEREEEREILIGLEAEFVDLQERLQRWTGYNRWGARMLDQVLSDSASELQGAALDSAFIAATVVNVLDQGGALEALLSSGRLELIRDWEIRARLAKWPDWLEDIHTNDLSARDFAMREIAPFLAAHGWPEFHCPANCRPPGPLSVAERTLLNAPQLRALLITRRRWMRGSAVDHEAADAEATALLEMIRGQLPR